jgi:hypothetical protein
VLEVELCFVLGGGRGGGSEYQLQQRTKETRKKKTKRTSRSVAPLLLLVRLLHTEKPRQLRTGLLGLRLLNPAPGRPGRRRPDAEGRGGDLLKGNGEVRAPRAPRSGGSLGHRDLFTDRKDPKQRRGQVSPKTNERTGNQRGFSTSFPRFCSVPFCCSSCSASRSALRERNGKEMGTCAIFLFARARVRHFFPFFFFFFTILLRKSKAVSFQDFSQLQGRRLLLTPFDIHGPTKSAKKR